MDRRRLYVFDYEIGDIVKKLYEMNKVDNKTDDDIFKWLDIKINDSSATYLLDEWTTRDINEFAQVVKSFLLERVAI